MNPFADKVFVIDKEKGPTSFQVVEAFRRAVRIRKTGHAGTLDPMAEGVLILCTGFATRATPFLIDLEKEYEFQVHFGVATDTDDADGQVIRQEDPPELELSRLEELARGFVGPYEQLPPRFAALKREGRRLYELARHGEDPPRKPRTVQIHDLQVVSIDPPRATFRVRCSRGTYVRALARDLGERLGVPAHASRLVRTRIGPFDRGMGFPSGRVFRKELEGLEGIPLERALDFLPAVVVGETGAWGVRRGMAPIGRQVVRADEEARPGRPVRILDEEGKLLAVGRMALARADALPVVSTYRLFVESAG
jgi:tRNA pseudouridine55 synthase